MLLVEKPCCLLEESSRKVGFVAAPVWTVVVAMILLLLVGSGSCLSKVDLIMVILCLVVERTFLGEGTSY